MLLPLLPLTLLGAAGDAGELAVRRWLPPLAAFSMLPLLKKDRLLVAYAAAVAVWAAVAWPARAAFCGGPARGDPSPEEGHVRGTQGPEEGLLRGDAGDVKQLQSAAQGPQQGRLGVVLGVSAVGAALIHVAGAVLPRSAKYPYLFDLLVTTYSFAHFAAVCLWLNNTVLIGSADRT